MIHKHKWELLSYSTKLYDIRCKCGVTEQVKPDKYQQKILKEDFKRFWNKREVKEMHGLAWKMQDLCKKYSNNYELICAVERLAKKHPDRIFICGVDDDYHSGSILVFVVDENKSSYHGVSVWMISQCAPNPPCPFFLYDSHMKELIPTLTKLYKHARIKSKKEDKLSLKQSKRFKKMVMSHHSDERIIK